MQVHPLLLKESPDRLGNMTGNYFFTIFCPVSSLNTDIASLLLIVV